MKRKFMIVSAVLAAMVATGSLVPASPQRIQHTRDDELIAMLTLQKYNRSCRNDDFVHSYDDILHLEGNTPAVRTARVNMIEAYQRKGHVGWCADIKARLWMGDDYRKH